MLGIRGGARVSARIPRHKLTTSKRIAGQSLRVAVQEGVEVEKKSTILDQDLVIAYRTGWKSGKAHGALLGGEWKDYPLTPITPVKRRWLFASIPEAKEPANGDALFEFVITDGNGEWDKPTEGGNYTVHTPGWYVLRKGTLQKATAPPVMVVSDLDGTMVGDDKKTAAFKAFWDNEGCPNGGILVYNTGRSLESFKKLQEEKGDLLAHPDVLISSVGTKVYVWAGKRWEEDVGFKGLLDEDWNVHEVIAAASHMLKMVGPEKMHFRPKEEQNEHKVTCGVNTAVLEEVLQGLQHALDEAGVKANLITSGTHDWRFMDMVSVRAGKLEALEYVRKKYGFPLEQTVACGDSGNDILMLSGDNLSLVVGNAQDDLKNWLNKRNADSNGHKPTTAEGKQRLLVASAQEALGILEGLEYWGLKAKS